MDAQQEDTDHRLLLDILPQHIFVLNAQAVVTYTNASSKQLGILADAFVWEQPFQGTECCRTAEEFNAYIKSRDGLLLTRDFVCCHIQASPFSIKASKYFLYTFFEVKDSLTANVKLDVPSNTHFQDLRVQEIEDYSILMLDKHGKIINANKGVLNVKGYAIDEIIGEHFETFYPLPDREAGLPRKMLAEAELNGKAIIEGWRMRKNGTLFWGNIVITAVHDAGGSVTGFTKVTRDFTEKKHIEEQREQQAKRIEAKNRQLEEFAYITSHDLQEPLRKISVFSELVKTNMDDRKYAEKYLDKIVSSTVRMRTLIKDILEYARVLDKPEEHQKIRLKEIIEGIIDDFELLISEKKVTIEIPETLPTLTVIPVQMQQLFTNLISNAIKFSQDSPKITIFSELAVVDDSEADLAKGNYYCISVTDNGIGFDQRYAEQIFKPFKRLHTDVSGTGIGLAVCQKIVENHRGVIQVSSVLHQGTIFKIYLPLT